MHRSSKVAGKTVPALLLHKVVIPAYTTKHRLLADPVAAKHSFAQDSAGHTRASSAVVVVRLGDFLLHWARLAFEVLFTGEPVHVVIDVIDYLSTCYTPGSIPRVDADHPGETLGDEAKLGQAGECCGGVAAFCP